MVEPAVTDLVRLSPRKVLLLNDVCVSWVCVIALAQKEEKEKSKKKGSSKGKKGKDDL